MTVYDYGVDIHTDFEFENGDIKLCEYEDNIIQAIANRLNTPQDSMDFFYTDYGSFLNHYYGWKKRNETLNFIKLEIINSLRKDPRINDITVELEYIEKGISINITLNDFGNINLNFNLTDDGVEMME